MIIRCPRICLNNFQLTSSILPFLILEEKKKLFFQTAYQVESLSRVVSGLEPGWLLDSFLVVLFWNCTQYPAGPQNLERAQNLTRTPVFLDPGTVKQNDVFWPWTVLLPWRSLAFLWGHSKLMLSQKFPCCFTEAGFPESILRRVFLLLGTCGQYQLVFNNTCTLPKFCFLWVAILNWR